MSRQISKLHAVRQNGQTQVEAQRTSILDAAEKLFLEKGLEPASMTDIAAAAGITRMSLYRYFPGRDEIAVEIHARMINRILALIPLQEMEYSREGAKKIIGMMIEHFDVLRDAYRFMGMFDSLYLDHPSNAELRQWTKDRLPALIENFSYAAQIPLERATMDRLLLLISTTIWFLEKLAMRGELTWSDPSTPLDTHLATFGEMIFTYLDSQPA